MMATTFNGGVVHPFRSVHHSSVSKETHFSLSFTLLTPIHPSPLSLSAHPEEIDTRRKISAWKFRVDLTDHLSSGQVWRVLPPSSLSPLLTNHANHAWAKSWTHGRYQHTHMQCATHIRGNLWTLGHQEEEPPFSSTKQSCVRVWKTQITITSHTQTSKIHSLARNKRALNLPPPPPHTHTHTHTHTHVGFYGLRGLSIGVMVFILYKLYVLLPYTYPTPKLSPHRRRCISIFPQKNSLGMLYKRFKLWGHWKCPHKSPSPCNTYVIPMSLYKFVSS